MTIYYILIYIIGVIVFFSPVIINAYRDYSNLEVGDRIWVNIQSETGSKVDFKDLNNYYPSVVERIPEDPSVLVYRDGLNYHVIRFSDFLFFSIMTEERFDSLTD